MIRSLLLAGLLPVSAFAANPTPDTKITYKKIGGATLQLHVFNPQGHKASDKRPAVVFFFGGGWVRGSPSQFYPHCEHLAAKGMVAIAAELGINPDQLAAGGGSAGGHVAAATAHSKGFEEDGQNLKVRSVPNALILFNPVLDNGPGEWGHEKVKDYWKDFSPANNISKGAPPAIAFLGSNDKLIPVATLERYQAAMQNRGSRCELHVYDGQGHGFFNESKEGGVYYKKTVAAMDKFLKSLGYLK